MVDIKKSIDYWDNLYESSRDDEITMDNWLEKFNVIIDKTLIPIIDLGCGSGNDTLYLLSRNKQVIASDFSPVAINNIKNNFPEVKAICFNMLDGLPFLDNSVDIVIADLSLHYFLREETIRLIKELKRVLTKNGHLIFRVNSVNDLNYGSGFGEQIEKHLYKTSDGRLKRFFDREDIEEFFKEFQIEYLKEETMMRYKLEKKLYRGCLRKYR